MHAPATGRISMTCFQKLQKHPDSRQHTQRTEDVPRKRLQALTCTKGVRIRTSKRITAPRFDPLKPHIESTSSPETQQQAYKDHKRAIAVEHATSSRRKWLALVRTAGERRGRNPAVLPRPLSRPETTCMPGRRLSNAGPASTLFSSHAPLHLPHVPRRNRGPRSRGLRRGVRIVDSAPETRR